jgi:hypothetical protein
MLERARSSSLQPRKHEKPRVCLSLSLRTFWASRSARPKVDIVRIPSAALGQPARFKPTVVANLRRHQMENNWNLTPITL